MDRFCVACPISWTPMDSGEKLGLVNGLLGTRLNGKLVWKTDLTLLVWFHGDNAMNHVRTKKLHQIDSLIGSPVSVIVRRAYLPSVWRSSLGVKFIVKFLMKFLISQSALLACYRRTNFPNILQSQLTSKQIGAETVNLKNGMRIRIPVFPLDAECSLQRWQAIKIFASFVSFLVNRHLMVQPAFLRRNSLAWTIWALLVPAIVHGLVHQLAIFYGETKSWVPVCNWHVTPNASGCKEVFYPLNWSVGIPESPDERSSPFIPQTRK